MGEPDNPFHYGSPATHEAFVDREDLLQDITSRMLNGQNIILLSPRRYGKTSLLLESIARVKSRQGRSGYASLLLCSTHREVAETILNAVLNGPLSWLTSQTQKLTQILSRVRLQPSIELDPIAGFRASLASAGAGSVKWQDVIRTILRLLAEAEEGKHPVSLVLDEFQQVAEIDPNLPALFKVMTDELRHVSLVFAGSKMHVMQRIAIGRNAPLLDIGERISMGPVPEEAMAPFLSRRARSAGKQLSLATAREIFRAVDGIPNDVQRLAYDCFELGPTVIDSQVVKAAMERVVSHRAVDYEEAFTRLSPGQQRVLKALAKAPRDSVGSRTFIEEVDLANGTSVRKALDVLSDLELVARRGQTWVVADAFLRGWLAANA